MSEPAAPEPPAAAVPTGAAAEFYISELALRRSRFLLRLFMLNWLLLGGVLLTVGTRSRALFIAAFAGGLLALVAGLAQRTVLRRAFEPILELGERALALRAVSALRARSIPWEEIATIEWSDERTIQIHHRSGRVEPFSVVALDEPQRERLRQALRQRRSSSP